MNEKSGFRNNKKGHPLQVCPFLTSLDLLLNNEPMIAN